MQVRLLREEKSGLEGRLEFLSGNAAEQWITDRVESTQHAINELKHGLKDPSRTATKAEWRVLGLSGMYHHMWRVREDRDALLQSKILEVRKQHHKGNLPYHCC